ncbi:MAG: hypothetical protein JW731_05700 [Bacteroidales bacterium]|nr:hypothetical protein [Bacteroidales bacterium]
MKKLVLISLLILVIIIPNLLTAQPQPWDPAWNGGEGAYPIGGGAPIGGGLLILLSLAIGYGVRKIYEARRKVLD